MNRFALAYREQQQLFLLDKTYLWGTLLKVGGLAALIARFIVQFFWNPAVALVLTLLLLALSAYLSWAAMRRSKADWRAVPLAIVPAFFLGASLSDNSLHFDFLIAFLMAQCGLVVYRNIRKSRLCWGALLTVILYFAAGPSAWVFALCALVDDIFSKGKDGLGSLIYPALVALCGAAAFFLAAVPTWSAALTPVSHYDLDASMPAAHWAAWGAMVLVIIVSAALRRGSGTVGLILGLLLLIASAIWSFRIGRNLENKTALTRYEYEYYTVNGRWDDLVASCKHHDWTPLTANYLNLALAWKGTLTEDLLKYDQRGMMSLAYSPEDKTVDVRLAHIMFAMGNMAAAQDVAFNAIKSTTGYCPAMLKMNAEIEIMRGAYEVADKYLTLLEKAPRYRSWARERRRFLWNDEAVEADPELGNGRRDFPLADGFAMFGNPVEELMRVVEANPADPRAMAYALSYLLLAKDVEGLYHFVDKYWVEPALKELPTPVQEALVFYSEYSRNMEGVEAVPAEWCAAHGVSAGTMSRFRSFQDASVQSGGAAPKGSRGTYWYYLIYTAI